MLVERIGLPHTRLLLYPKGWYENGFYFPVVFDGACFGALKGKELPFEVREVVFPYKKWVDHNKLPVSIYKRYVNWLSNLGFAHQHLIFDTWNKEPFDAHQGMYKVSGPIHMLEWFSTYQVVRYTYENPQIILWWDKMCEAHPEADKWLIFCMRHRIHAGHTLMSPRFTSVVNPTEVLAKIRSEKNEIGEWNPAWFKGPEKQLILFKYWGGDRPFAEEDLNNGDRNEEKMEANFQKEYDKLVKLKESK